MNEYNDQSSNSESQKNHGISRRSFINKAAVSAPVLAAFVSKPSWSTDQNCINSGTLSGNLSNHNCQAQSRNAQWWSQDSNRILWSAHQIPNITPDTPFRDIFQCNPLACRTPSGKYYKNKHLNSDGSVSKLLTIGKDCSIMDILKGRTRSRPSREAANVDKAIIAAYLNIMHPGIAYDGYEVGALIADYHNCIHNFMATADNAIFDEFYEKLEGPMGLNNMQDMLPGA